jgi:solute carrier family 35 protein E3
VWAVCGILSTSLYQIYIKSKQQDLQLNSYQLLFLQTPTSAAMVLLLSMMSEPWLPLRDAAAAAVVDSSSAVVLSPPSSPLSLLSFPYTSFALLVIFASAVLSFAVNLSIFVVIGRTSPVAYNVLGHFKLVCILLSGVAFFDERFGTTKSIGTMMTLMGVIAFTHFQQTRATGWEQRERNRKDKEQQGREGDTKKEYAYQPTAQRTDEEDNDDGADDKQV